MFKSFQSIVKPSTRAGGYVRRRSSKSAFTIFSDSSGRVMKVAFKVPGRRGNGYIANLLKINNTKYRFRGYDNGEVRLNTITETDAVAPPEVIENLVASINSNNTFKNYFHVTFYKETTEAISDSVSVEDGQKLRGGR